MKASQLITSLTRLMEMHGDLDLIWSRDDEGNGFDYIDNTASACMFITTDDVMFDTRVEPNAFCVN